VPDSGGVPSYPSYQVNRTFLGKVHPAVAIYQRRQGAGDSAKARQAWDRGESVHRCGKRRSCGWEVPHGQLCRDRGLGSCAFKSGKQQIIKKSSTEAELVALSDSANQGLHTRSFLMVQGYECGPISVYQDNVSCMALIERGRSSTERARHLDIRHFWIKERLDMGEAIIKHQRTKEMYANLLTKPLQGMQFAVEREALTGWN
jgi:hypothetical protein